MKPHKHRDPPPALHSRMKTSRLNIFPGPRVGLAALALFIAVVAAVDHIQQITSWDVRALQWLHSGTSPLGIDVLTAVSLAGSPEFLACLGLIVAVLLIWKRQRNYLAGWIVALVGGEILESVLKLLIQRPRPEYSDPLLTHFTYSLPSGHAMTSLIAYSMFSHVLISVWKPNRAAQIGILATAVLLIMGIGFSRVYLGVHYVSDIVAGFAAGTFWASLCIYVTTFRQSRIRSGPERTS